MWLGPRKYSARKRSNETLWMRDCGWTQACTTYQTLECFVSPVDTNPQWTLNHGFIPLVRFQQILVDPPGPSMEVTSGCFLFRVEGSPGSGRRSQPQGRHSGAESRRSHGKTVAQAKNTTSDAQASCFQESPFGVVARSSFGSSWGGREIVQ